MTQPAQFDHFTIERMLPASRERVFAAFADPARKQRWFAEGGQHEVEHFLMEFQVGGREQARYRFKQGTPFAGVSLESDGVFLDIVEGSRIVTAASMAIGGRRISASLHSVELSAASEATTRMLFTHQAAFFEGADGPAIRRAGWEQLLAQLQSSLLDA